MIDETLRNYWTLIRAHRHGDDDALIALDLMASGTGKEAGLADAYVQEQSRKGATGTEAV